MLSKLQKSRIHLRYREEGQRKQMEICVSPHYHLMIVKQN